MKVVVLKPEDEHLIVEFERAKAAHLQAIKAVEEYRAAHDGAFDDALFEAMTDAMHAEFAAISAIQRKG